MDHGNGTKGDFGSADIARRVENQVGPIALKRDGISEQ
jgi:hypothetical protein